MTFEELIKKRNGGILRGAQLRLAEKFHLAHNTVSQWMSGKSKPSEILRPKLAKELGVSVDELMKSLQPAPQERIPHPRHDPEELMRVQRGTTDAEIILDEIRDLAKEVRALQSCCETIKDRLESMMAVKKTITSKPYGERLAETKK